MASPKSKGRMIRKSISASEAFASLTKESQVLFPLLIAHLNSHGKLNGSPNFIKGEVCPLIDWLDLQTIQICLKDISEKTNLKWFNVDRLCYLHALSWKRHQDLNASKLGEDVLPSYPSVLVQDKFETSPELVHHEVKDQVKVEEEAKEEGQVKDKALTSLKHGLKIEEEGVIRNEIAEKLNHGVGSQANDLEFDGLVKKVAKQKDVKNPVAYMIQAARNLGK